MYTISFEGGEPLRLPNKQALRVALKFDKLRRGKLLHRNPKTGEGNYDGGISLYPFFPTPQKGAYYGFFVPRSTYFLTRALDALKMAAIFRENWQTFEERDALVAAWSLTPEEEKIAFKYFGHKYEEEYAREYEKYEKEYDLKAYDYEAGHPYDDIPLVLYDLTLDYAGTKPGGYYKELYGERAPEDVVKELIAKRNKK